MKGLMLIKENFELCEALITIDLLRRADIVIDTISLNDELRVMSQSNVEIKCDHLLKDIDLNDYSFLIIPGGKAVFNYHINSDVTMGIIKHFNNHKQLIACICAAPMVLGKMGLLDNKPFVCYPGCETGINGKYQKNKKVVINENIITSKGMGTTFEFAQAIITYVKDQETAKKVINSVYYG